MVQQRLGLCDLTGLLEQGHDVKGSAVASAATVRRMTKPEKRLLVATYLGARIEKQEDTQLFMPEGRGRRYRGKNSAAKQESADGPAFLREPKPVVLPRLFAIYHRLAQQPQALSFPLMEQLMALREAGFLRFAGERPGTAERDPRVICGA